MSEPIKHRYDFEVLLDVKNGNPNGDPDAGGQPRIDEITGNGIITDVCLKRKIRNYVATVKEGIPGYKNYIKSGISLERTDKYHNFSWKIDNNLAIVLLPVPCPPMSSRYGFRSIFASLTEPKFLIMR